MILSKDGSHEEFGDTINQAIKLMNIISEGVAIISDDEIVLWVNHALTKLLGYSAAELIGTSYHKVHLAKHDTEIRREIQITLQKTDLWEDKVVLKRKNGETIPILLSLSKVTNDAAELLYYCAIVKDLSENFQLKEEQVNLIKQTATAQKLASLTTMSAGIVQQLIHPLNAIKILVDGILYWHKNKYSLELSELIQKLQEISWEVGRMEAILRPMRSFASINQDMELEPCSLNELVKQSWELMERQLSAHGIILKTRLAKQIPEVLGNANRLEEVIINLLVNAMHTLDTVNKPNKTITCSTFVYGHKIILEISDNATGIREEIIEHLFEPFFTTIPNPDCIGLGLPIVQLIITKFNGNIQAFNNQNGGATFRVELPPMISPAGGKKS